MSVRSSTKAQPGKGYAVGSRNFAAISAVEGLTLTPASKVRLERNRDLSPEQRRAETLKAFSETRNHK